MISNYLNDVFWIIISPNVVLTTCFVIHMESGNLYVVMLKGQIY
jgi:hypothetical protein